MSIENREGNVLTQSDLTHIVHQANVYCTFGAGIAKQIKERFPEAYEADCKTIKGDLSKVGSYSFAKTKSGLTIINLYSQIGIGGQDRRTSYDAMVKGFESIRHSFGVKDSLFPPNGTHCLVENKLKYKLGIPYGIGCGLANGSWTIVNSIIEDVFSNSDLDVVICQLF